MYSEEAFKLYRSIVKISLLNWTIDNTKDKNFFKLGIIKLLKKDNQYIV